jgi:tRNA (cmo5U34)-methyltransferase
MKDHRAFDFDDDYGREYDYIARTVIPAYDQIFDAGVALLRAAGQPPTNLLVVGCGTGREIETFAPAFPECRITGLDPSREMIGRCERIRHRDELESRLDLVCGVTSDLPDEPRFDAATVYNVMHFLPDDGPKAELLASVAARVRPGGHVVLFDLHGEPGDAGFQPALDAWYTFFEDRGLSGEARNQFVDRLERGIVYVGEDRILEHARAAGLEPVFRWFTGFLYGGWFLRRR